MAKKSDTSPKIPGDDWVNAQWRPMMAWAYMAIVLFDFIIAPILWGGLQAFFSGSVAQQWIPLTLGGGGLFHVAMSAVLGISAWSRGQEKISAIRNRWGHSHDRFGPLDNVVETQEEELEDPTSPRNRDPR